YVRIWERAMDFDPRKAPAIAWMIAIARNRALDEHRRTAVGLIAADADPEVANVVSEDKDPLAVAEQNDNLRRLAECLSKLDKNTTRDALQGGLTKSKRTGRNSVLLLYANGISGKKLSSGWRGQWARSKPGCITAWCSSRLVSTNDQW